MPEPEDIMKLLGEQQDYEITQNAGRMGGKTYRKNKRPHFSPTGSNVGRKDCTSDLSVYFERVGYPLLSRYRIESYAAACRRVYSVGWLFLYLLFPMG